MILLSKVISMTTPGSHHHNRLNSVRRGWLSLSCLLWCRYHTKSLHFPRNIGIMNHLFMQHKEIQNIVKSFQMYSYELDLMTSFNVTLSFANLVAIICSMQNINFNTALMKFRLLRTINIIAALQYSNWYFYSQGTIFSNQRSLAAAADFFLQQRPVWLLASAGVSTLSTDNIDKNKISVSRKY